MSPAEFSKEMLSELRKEPLFRYYWSATLDSLVPEAVAYEFVPTETLSYFRRVFETDLFPVANRAPFAGTSCRFMLSLTAACGGSPIRIPPVDFGSIVKGNDRTGGDKQAAFVRAVVSDRSRRPLAELSWTLWSSDPSQMQGDSKFLASLLAEPQPAT